MTGADGSPDPDAGPGWRWDVALSFAGAQRHYVEQVAGALAARGVRCFYDADEEIGLWGKSLAEVLPEIYGEQAAAVVIFASAEYAARDWTRLERRAALARAVRERREYVLPTRFDDTQLPGLLPDVSYMDLRTKAPQQFAAVIVSKLATLGIIGREVGPQRHGSGPRTWNIPARNPMFTGRNELLVAIRERLLAGGQAVVQALYGMGGIGKTQLAIEYAHQFAEDYDFAWWINSEHGGLVGDQFAELGDALECTEAGMKTEVVRARVLAKLREPGHWLLVFDNAQYPADITPWLPGRGGHVLITSRKQDWAQVAASVKINLLARAESVTLLETWVRGPAQTRGISARRRTGGPSAGDRPGRRVHS